VRPKIEEALVKKKSRYDAHFVHSPFTPVGRMLMADIVRFTFGDQLAPACC
jgi:hypothetical protein